MDRNLGARDETRNADGKGNLQYQYGRKDPLATGNVNGSAVTTAYRGRTSTLWTITGVSAEPDGVPISQSVNIPMNKYNRSTYPANWCSAVNSSSIIWHDMDYDVSSNGKSIFDPSPYGWKVPADGVWAGFSTSTTTWSSDDGQYGLCYPAEDPIAYYPATGARASTSASLGDFTTAGVSWSSTPYNELISYSFQFASTYVSPSLTGAGRASGRTVRPVQHYEHLFGN